MEKAKKYLLSIFIILIIISGYLIFFVPTDLNVLPETLLAESTEENPLEKIYIAKESMHFINSPIPKTYLKKFNKTAKEDLIGKSQDFVLNTFGNPTYEVIYKEIYKDKESIKKVYLYIPKLPEEEADSSALFIVMKNELVYDYTIDEFTGFSEDTPIDIFKKFK